MHIMETVQMFRSSDYLICGEAIHMSTRLTFVVTEEMEPILSRVKKDLFYDRTKSDMIRELVMAGLSALDSQAQEDQNERAC